MTGNARSRLVLIEILLAQGENIFVHKNTPSVSTHQYTQCKFTLLSQRKHIMFESRDDSR